MQFLKDRSGWLGLSFVVIAVCITGAVCSAESGVEVESSGVYRSGEDILGEKETLPARDVQGEKEDPPAYPPAVFSSEPSEAAGGVSAGVSSSAPEEGFSGAGKTAPLICVFVSGAVEKEGVYRLPEGARVYQAVEAAGGFRADADTSYVNLALILGDEDVIRIPAKEESGADAEGSSTAEGSSGGKEENSQSSGKLSGSGKSTEGVNTESFGVIHRGDSGTGTKGDTKGGSGSGGLININTASREELMTLPGIGESKADAILEYRKTNGGFGTKEEIMNITGIKEGVYSKIEDKITAE